MAGKAENGIYSGDEENGRRRIQREVDGPSVVLHPFIFPLHIAK